jgi:hypothetical protein
LDCLLRRLDTFHHFPSDGYIEGESFDVALHI